MSRHRPCRLCYGTGSRYLATPEAWPLLALIACPCAEDLPVREQQLGAQTEGSPA